VTAKLFSIALTLHKVLALTLIVGKDKNTLQHGACLEVKSLDKSGTSGGTLRRAFEREFLDAS
jgi:hypothetical protein